MEACKLQRHHSQHCGTTNKVFVQELGVVILLSTEAAELTWDWLKITVGLTKGSDW